MLEIVDSLNPPARIKVFGVGGGGSNAVNRMIQAGLSGVEFWVANTDLQALHKAGCTNRMQIGCGVTRGLGAGGDPEIGRLSAQEDRESILEVLRGTDMLFITAGMGGGTGTGAAPVVAEIARELGILTVAIVTKPFGFEGKKKMARAQSGLAELGQRVDTLIAIPNQKLLNIVEPSTPFLAAMLVADEVLFQATRGISDLITGHGEINLDFADVKTVMRNRGNALLGCGVATGKNRAIEAAQAAVSSPLLEEVSIFGAEALLINVQGGPGMGLHEAAEAAQFISERVGEEADVFWGAVVDPLLDEEMRVTLIATGFQKTESVPERKPEPLSAREAVRDLVRDMSREPAGEPVREAFPLRETSGLRDGSIQREASAPHGPAVDPMHQPSLAPPPERRRAPLEMVFASTPIRGEDEGADGDGAELLPPAWAYDRPAEPEIFLPEDADPNPSFIRIPVLRESWDPPPAPVAERSTRSTGGMGAFLHRLDPRLDARLGRRNPLDEPAFMRKKMD